MLSRSSISAWLPEQLCSSTVGTRPASASSRAAPAASGGCTPRGRSAASGKPGARDDLGHGRGVRGRALVRAAGDGDVARLEVVALDHAVAHRRQRLQRLGRAAQHARESRRSPARGEHGALAVHDDGVHAVTRLDDAPAHFLDDACLPPPAYDNGMPELPELEALVEALDPLVSRAPVRDVPIAHFAVVKTATPPLDWLGGHALTGAVRRGKHLLFPTDDDLVLTIHLMTAGKLAYVEPGAKRPPGAPVLVVRFDDDGELVVSERVTRKSVRVRLLPAAELDEEFARLGPEPLDPSFDDAALEAALARGGQLHTLLRDQRAIRRHRARVRQRDPARGADWRRSRRPTGSRRRSARGSWSRSRRTLTDGIERFRPRGPRMIAKGKTPEVYDIHGHAGEACPRCGSTMQNVDFADHQVVYCPSCQTGGQVYADRRRSRLLK